MFFYTSGIWNVSEGHADEFQHAWQQAIGQLDAPRCLFRLLRDVENPQRYLSVGGPWRSREQIDTARDSKAYQDSMAATRAHLVENTEDKVTTYEFVLEVSGRLAEAPVA